MERIKREKKRGNYKIPKFKKYFPEGIHYEFWHTCSNKVLCLSTVPNKEISYLGMYKKGFVKGFYSEVLLKPDSKYIIVYDRKKKFFFPVPKSLEQENALKFLRGDFYQANFIDKKDRYNPNKAIFNVNNFVLESRFRKNLQISKAIYKKMQKILLKDYVNPMIEVRHLLKNSQKKIKSTFPEVNLIGDFELNSKIVNYLNRALGFGLQDAINGLKFVASSGEIASRILIGTPAPRLTIPPIYIVPNDQTTLILAFISHKGRKVFKHHSSVYYFMEQMIKYLKLMKKEIPLVS